MALYFLVGASALLDLLFAATLPEGYESKTAEQKLDVLWTNITNKKHEWSNLPTATYAVQEFLDGLGDTTNNIVPLFTRQSDEMVFARKKFVSTYGVICKIRMQILPNSTYTGVFQPGIRKHVIQYGALAYDLTWIVVSSNAHS